jgi:Tol biopolymer transport system component
MVRGGETATVEFRVSCQRRVTAPPPPAPQPTRIAWVSTRDGNREIYVMNVDGSGAARLTTSAEQDSDPSWHPGGDLLAWTTAPAAAPAAGEPELSRLAIADLAAGTREVLDPSSTVSYGYPAWSPDGARLAFSSSLGSATRNIFIAPPDLSQRRQVTAFTALTLRPSWSPDGARIAFDSDNEIWVANADGTVPYRLTFHAGVDINAQWSPDGRRILFQSNRAGNFDLYVMDADGSSVRRLTSDLADDIDAVWSPDGARILFASRRDGDLELHVMDADGGNVRQLTVNGADDFDPSWR